ncbi:hypothetical protein C8R45DRAFT_938051 [Mycena sanguinolenta]|nr:hypothetical protein C8R45DRAFT_938051 [Mycena sanguinolenta]
MAPVGFLVPISSTSRTAWVVGIVKHKHHIFHRRSCAGAQKLPLRIRQVPIFDAGVTVRHAEETRRMAASGCVKHRNLHSLHLTHPDAHVLSPPPSLQRAAPPSNSVKRALASAVEGAVARIALMRLGFVWETPSNRRFMAKWDGFTAHVLGSGHAESVVSRIKTICAVQSELPIRPGAKAREDVTRTYLDAEERILSWGRDVSSVSRLPFLTHASDESRKKARSIFGQYAIQYSANIRPIQHILAKYWPSFFWQISGQYPANTPCIGRITAAANLAQSPVVTSLWKELQPQNITKELTMMHVASTGGNACLGNPDIPVISVLRLWKASEMEQAMTRENQRRWWW